MNLPHVHSSDDGQPAGSTRGCPDPVRQTAPAGAAHALLQVDAHHTFRHRRLAALLIFASAWSCIGSGCNPAAEAPAAGLRVDRLRCEYLEDPLGIDVTPPQLSWVLE